MICISSNVLHSDIHRAMIVMEKMEKDEEKGGGCYGTQKFKCYSKS